MAKTGQIIKTKAGAEMSLASPFRSRSEVQTPAGVVVKSMSPLLKPANWPKDEQGNNKIVLGVFTKIFVTRAFTQKVGGKTVEKLGLGVEIVPEGAPVGVALPVTATLQTALEITGEGKAATSQFVGRTVEIDLLPDRLASTKGQKAWHFVAAIYPAKK